MERLQKIIAQSNIASRRKAEAMILEGRVSVNNEVITTLGFKVSRSDEIKVDGKPITKAEHVYFLLNKPTGYVSTTSDDKKRLTVIDLLEPEHKNLRIYPVGRLDYDTAGLLLLTNDGELTKILTHPSFEVEKEYIVRVEGIVIKEKIRTLRKGITIEEDGLVIPKNVSLLELHKPHQSSLLSITVIEGKNRMIRKMMDAIGHPVKNLTRIRYDFLSLEGVERGKYRLLKVHEIKKLYAHAAKIKG